jgi:hypothetical protein
MAQVNNRPGAIPVSDTLTPDTTSVAVVDTVTEIKSDTVKEGPFQPNPKRAGLYSALLPGLGQIYNRQYWKLPIVYAGLGVATYFFIDNLNTYQIYRKAYIGRINNNFPTDEFVDIYSQPQLKQLQEDYNGYMNMTVLYTSLGFVLQIIDAITSAHLKNFDISRDISLRPMVTPKGMGMGLVVNF